MAFCAALLGGCLDEDALRPLQVIDSVPAAGADHPSGAPIRIVFDGYLDPTINLGRAVLLSSGDVSAGADVGYDPSGPALVVVPRIDLRADLAYTVTVDPLLLFGLDGRQLAEPFTLGFTARATPGQPAPAPVDFARDLAPVFERRCGCHGEEPSAFPPLRPDALIDVPSPSDPSKMLVDPGDPLRSVLVLKVLPDYPQIFGLAMPPDDGPLSGETIRKLVSWIEAGAGY